MMLQPLKSRLKFASNIAILASCVNFFSPTICYTQSSPAAALSLDDASYSQHPKAPAYTVNFNNVPVIEVIRFVSKITNLNFIFNEDDIQFNVTIVSEEPITIKNIISALIQVLRINDLTLLEQDSNLIITKSTTVGQIATIVDEDTQNKDGMTAPIVTRVFRVKNANISSIANIIRPMTSKGALIETSPETRQLIITDITTNIEKITTLLTTLDTPHTSLEIDSFEVKNISTKEIVTLANQLLSPFTEGNPLIFVPQPETNTIFIVSTPYLLERAVAVLEDLDMPVKEQIAGHPVTGVAPTVHLYKLLGKNPDQYIEILKEIKSRLASDSSTTSSSLIHTIDTAEYIKEIHTLLFLCDDETWKKLEPLLQSVGDASAQENALFMYQPQNTQAKNLLTVLTTLSSSSNDQTLQDTVKTATILPDSNSLSFRGPKPTIDELKNLCSMLDSNYSNVFAKGHFLLYTPKNLPLETLIDAINTTIDNLRDSGLNDLLSSLSSVKQIKSSKALLFTGNPQSLDEVKTIVADLDKLSSQVYIYKAKQVTPKQLLESLKTLSSASDNPSLAQAIDACTILQEQNALLFHSSEATLEWLKLMLPSLDSSENLLPSASKASFRIYNIKHIAAKDMLVALKNTVDNFTTTGLSNDALLQTLKSARAVPDTNSIVLTGDKDSLQKAEEIITSLDVEKTGKSEESILIYRGKNLSADQIIDALQQVTQSSQDTQLKNVINQAVTLKDQDSVVFNGSKLAIEHLQNLLSSVDVAGGAIPGKAKGQFFIYTPQHVHGQDLLQAIHETYQELNTSGLTDPSLLFSLASAKWVPSTNSIIITGDPSSIEKAKEIITSLDAVKGRTLTQQPFLYKPQYASDQQLLSALSKYCSSLDTQDPSDKRLVDAVEHAQVIPGSTTIAFKSDPMTITRLKEILASIDNPKGLTGGIAKSFIIYQLQYASGNFILENLNNFSSILSAADAGNQALIETIRKIEWIKSNNTLLITGAPDVIDEVKNIIANFDTPSAKSPPIPKTDFLVYKPKYKTDQQLISILADLAVDLKDSGLIDDDLLHTLQNAKAITSSNSILFTGSQASLEKLGILLTSVDVPGEQKHVESLGATQFAVYKIKEADPETLLRALKSFAAELLSGSPKNVALAQTLGSAKYIPDTHSLLFTGPAQALEQAESLAEKFDTPSMPQPARAPVENFVVYSPQYQSGQELIAVLGDFKQSLINSGLNDQRLYDTISHLQFIDKTNALIITGDPESITKIQDLLQKFDIPSKGESAPAISTIDTANFLIYKLQYHKGGEIQTALKEISTSLNRSSSATNKNLVDAIDSLQWIEVTNSLLGTGNSEVLGKLKELIESIDIPLRQVFIEVLVIETTLNNAQNFGLQWGTQLQYLNKTIGAGGNFPIHQAGIPFNNPAFSATPPNFGNNIQNTTASLTPSQGGTSNNSIPFTSGFDLGIIGDIIMHKGKSFISLGSLMNAIQVDGSSTVVMNPKIIAQDGNTSTIFVGQNIPFTGSYVSLQGASNTQTYNIEYRDVGVSLTITPTLGTNNVITLDINQDISETLPSAQQAGVQVQGITTAHNSMNTRVHVPDNHFLVLSGMINDSKNNFRTSIPCLGGLPVVGALFSENDRNASKTNVIVFLRPTIVDSFDDYDKLTEKQEALYKESATTQLLKEQFDAGTEMIKSLGDE